MALLPPTSYLLPRTYNLALLAVGFFLLRSRLDRHPRPVPNGEPVGPHAIPFLNKQPLLLEHQTNLARIVAGDLFQDRNQHAERIVTDHRAPRDLRDMSRFRCRDREAIAAIDVQHYVNVGASITDVHDAIARNAEANSQRINRGYLAVTGGNLDDRFHLAGFIAEAEVGADDVIGGHE